MSKGAPTVIIQNRDGSLLEANEVCWSEEHDPATCYATLSASELSAQRSLFDRMIAFAFDVIGVQRLDVRVYEDER